MVEAIFALKASLSGPAGTERLAAVGLEPDDLADPVSIQKAWHGVHFVLAGTTDEPTEPPGDAVLGGRPIGEDLGYGPLRIHSAKAVARTSRALSTVDLAKLRTQVTVSDLTAARIYPEVWDTDAGALDWILDEVVTVREIYARTAAAGNAMLLFIR